MTLRRNRFGTRCRRSNSGTARRSTSRRLKTRRGIPILVPHTFRHSPYHQAQLSTPLVHLPVRALSFSSTSNRGSEINSLVEAIAANPLTGALSPKDGKRRKAVSGTSAVALGLGEEDQQDVAMDPRTDASSAKAKARTKHPRDRPVTEGEVELDDSNFPLRSLRVDPVGLDSPRQMAGPSTSAQSMSPVSPTKPLVDKAEFPPMRLASKEAAADPPRYPIPEKPRVSAS